MKLSIIIVNYNTFQVTCDCISSIIASDLPFSYEIILVDNASTECPAALFVEKFSIIKLVEAGGNVGFARGNNLGYDASVGEYILFLNSDTLVNAEALRYCVTYLDDASHKRVALVGCRLLYIDQSLQLSSFNYRVGIFSSLLDNVFVGKLLQKMGMAPFRNLPHILKEHEEEHKTEAVLGAFMFCRRSVIDEVGSFDNDFFMYYEELDWCYRISDAGYDIMYLPQVSIVHLEGGSNGAPINRNKTANQHALSKMLLIYKRYHRQGLFAYNIISIANIYTNKLIAPLRSEQWRKNAQKYESDFHIARKYQKYMLANYQPTRNSAAATFKLADLVQKGVVG